jgi:hypothetical protein
VAVAGLYLAVAAAAWGWPLPFRLLYDGFSPPPPYHWVRPPAALARGNQPPEPGEGTVALLAGGSSSGSILTGDAQAGVIFPTAAVEDPPGESFARVTIVPLDPSGMPPPPAGLRFDGNAYRVEAVYGISQKPVVLRRPVTVVLRYPTGATNLVRLSGSTWTEVTAQTAPLAFQIYTNTRALGVFVAAGPPQTGPSVSVVIYRVVSTLLWIAVIVVVVGLIRDYLGRRSRPARTGPKE